MRFRIDLKIFLFAVLFYFTKQIEVYGTIMIFAIIHELGHLLVGLLLGMKPEKMEIMPYGISISFPFMPRDYNRKVKQGNQLEVKKIFVALAGPITNVIMILIVLPMNVTALYANWLLILFNLLPIYPLDGGRIMKGILHIFLGKSRAEKYTNGISFVVLMMVTFASSILIYQIENIAIFLIVLVLWGIFIKEDRVYERRKKIYDLVGNLKLKEEKY